MDKRSYTRTKGAVCKCSFEVLNSTQAETLSEISGKWFTNAKTMIKSYKELDDKSKEALNKAVSIFVKVGKDNFRINAKNDILKVNNK